MIRRFLTILTLLGVFALETTIGLAQAQMPKLPPGETPLPHATVGIYAPRGKDVALKMWAPTIDWLNHSVQGTKFSVKAYTGEELQSALDKKEVEFIFAPSSMISYFGRTHPISRIATERSANNIVNGILADGGVLVVSKNSPAKSLDDLQGYTLWAASPLDFSGYGSLIYELKVRGRKISDYFTNTRFTGNPTDAVIYRVRSGQLAAGIVPACLIERMVQEGLINRSDLRVLNAREEPGFQCALSTSLFPSWSLGAVDSVPRLTITKVLTALVALPPQSSTALASNSRGWGAPATSYQVDTFLQTLDLPEELTLRTIRYWIAHYQAWGWGTMAVVLALIIYHLTLQVKFSRTKRELQETHAELDIKRQALEHAQRVAVVGELGTSLAHELNQPLESILNYAHGCRAIASQIPQAQPLLDPLECTEKEVKRASSVVKRLRQLIHADTGELRDVSPITVMSETLELFNGLLKKHGIILQRVSPIKNLDHWPIDAIGFQQLLVNVIKNAIDALTDPADPTDIPTITIREWMTDNGYELWLQDNGKGFPENKPPLIQAFFTTKKNGLGLGLPMCIQVAEQMQAKFTIEAAPHRGIIVRFSLPKPKNRKIRA